MSVRAQWSWQRAVAPAALRLVSLSVGFLSSCEAESSPGAEGRAGLRRPATGRRAKTAIKRLVERTEKEKTPHAAGEPEAITCGHIHPEETA